MIDVAVVLEPTPRVSNGYSDGDEFVWALSSTSVELAGDSETRILTSTSVGGYKGVGHEEGYLDYCFPAYLL